MTRRIHVLPDHVANQIAAGEVVERPSSVVKELVENALDAGATRVRVEVEDGGKRRIRVLDNGSGMTAEDALTALLRHATSKVHSEEDLRQIGTLGFRGEALPSIRSVSRFSIRTRRPEDDCGVRIVADGPDEPMSEPSGGPSGTEVVVSELFYNVPARRKFLRRTGTEMSRITAFIDQVALGWPEVHFTLVHNGRRSAEYPADRDLQARILSVLGRDVCHRLFRVSLEMGDHSVMGYTSEPTLNRPNNRGMFTYVNGRFVRDKVVQHAVTQAYGAMLERGRYPMCVLYVNVPPQAVDINVHPAKSEVRFVESGAIHGLIERSLRLTLSDAPWAEMGTVPMASPLGGDGTGLSTLPLLSRLEPTGENAPDLTSNVADSAAPGWAGGRAPVGLQDLPPSPVDPGPGLVGVDGPAPDDPGQAGFFSRLNYVGQVARCYLVCQSASAMHVIDQHAAHERVVYERLHARWMGEGVEGQRLLFPMQVALEPTLAHAAEEHAEDVRRLGFGIEPFGGNDWLLSEVPALLADRDPVKILQDLLSELAEVGHSRLVESRLEHLLATMACHAAVRSGDELTPREAVDLLRQMDGVPLRANCPHGRPVIITHGLGDIARWFNRT